MTNHPIYPEVLITTSAVKKLIGEPAVRIVEVDLDPTRYEEGHIRGAILWDWKNQLRDPETHEILSKDQIEALLCQSGIHEDDLIILYGDENNWFACWAFWLLSLYGHQRILLMDGGTRKWFAEEREVTEMDPTVVPSKYRASEIASGDRAKVEDIFESFFTGDSHKLVDVRSAYEYVGRIAGPAGVKPNCEIAGHIPTAINIPWNLNCNEDGTFKRPEELRELYASFGIDDKTSVITYCAIGERASLSWFVLRHLLKHPNVMTYDRSMSQWSRITHAPIAGGKAA